MRTTLLFHKPINMPSMLRTLLLPFFVMVFSVSTTAVQAQTTNAYAEAGLAAPTVTSDKEDYAPGEVAHITGKGWALDTHVEIHLDEEPEYEHDHSYHDVVVDAQGNWSVDYPIEIRHLGVKFTVIVDGKQSNYRGTTVFTDGLEIRLSEGSLTPCSGSTVKFSSSLTGNDIPPTGTNPGPYQWFKDGLKLTDGTLPNGSVISGATTSTLTLTNVGTNNSGEYTLEYHKPGFKNPISNTKQTDQNLQVGSGVSAPNASVTQQPTCAIATGTITIGAVPSNIEYSINGGTSWQTSTTFNNVAANTTYNVIARNGTCTSTATPVTVDPQPVAPTFTTNAGNQSLTYGDNASFSVVASGNKNIPNL
jgi:hypothetical protein